MWPFRKRQVECGDLFVGSAAPLARAFYRRWEAEGIGPYLTVDVPSGFLPELYGDDRVLCFFRRPIALEPGYWLLASDMEDDVAALVLEQQTGQIRWGSVILQNGGDESCRDLEVVAEDFGSLLAAFGGTDKLFARA